MRTPASPQHSLGRQSGPPGRMARARAAFLALCLLAALAVLLLNLPPALAQQSPSQDAITTLPLFPADWNYYLNSGSGGVQGGWVYLIANSSYQHARYNPSTQTWEILNVGTPSSDYPAITSDPSYLYMVIPVQQNPAYRYPWVFRAQEPAAGKWLFRGYMYNYPVGDIKGRPLAANGKMYFCFWTMSSSQACRSFDLASQTHTGIATIPFWQSSAFQLWVQDPADPDKALVLFAPDISPDYRLFSYSFSQDRWDVHSMVCGGAGLPKSLDVVEGRLYVTCLDKVSSPTQTRFFVWDRGQWRLHAVYDLATLEVTVPLISVPGYGLLHFDLRGGRTVQRRHFLYRPGTQPGPSGEPLPTPSPDPPRVMSTTPATGAGGVPIGASVTVTFDRLLDPATVTTESFLLREGFLLGALPRTVSWSASTKSVTIAPSSLLRQGATHLVTVGGGVRSIDGVAMGADYTFSFVTQGAWDYLAPTDPLAQPLYSQYANLVDLITSLSGSLAALSFVWGGYTYMNAGGDPRRAEQGRNAMLGALSGLLLVLLARAIVAVLLHNITVVTP